MLLTHETRYVVVCRRLVMRGFRVFSMPFRQMTVSWFLTVLLFATVFFIGNVTVPATGRHGPLIAGTVDVE